MKTFSKLFPWFFGLLIICILAIWITAVVVAYNGIKSVNEVGLKNVVEQVWCGKDSTCKLSDIVK